jgi:hypothetical protein
LSAFQTTGDVLAGGSFVHPTTGTNANNTRNSDPVIVVGECGLKPDVTHFRIPDPFSTNTNPDPSDPDAFIPADIGGYTTAVAASADNDAWAATNGGSALGPFGSKPERPHIYRLTDGRPPDAPAGDDNETRPIVFVPEPTQYVVPPPVTVTTAPPPKTVIHHRKAKQVHLKAAIYGVHSKLTHSKLTQGPRASFVLRIIFRVRRTVTIGAEGLLHGKVVTSSGLHRFLPGTGELKLKLNRKRWPKKIIFVFPRAKK